MTPAEELRAAAKLMREHAEGATPGPWYADDCYDVRSSSPQAPHWAGQLVAESGRSATYIAGMHPGVALAVADWLEREAALFEAQVFPQSDPVMEKYPLAVARAYLGSDPR